MLYEPINMLNFDTAFDLYGVVEEANIIKPYSRYGDPEKYRLRIVPENLHDFKHTMGRRIKEYKDYIIQNDATHESELEYLYAGKKFSTNKDMWENKWDVNVETLHLPRLHGEPVSWIEDSMWRGQPVKVRGHIQVIRPDMNAFLSFHSVDYFPPEEVVDDKPDCQPGCGCCDWDF